MILPKMIQTAVAARWALRMWQAASSLEAIGQHWLGLSAIRLGAAVPSMTPLMTQSLVMQWSIGLHWWPISILGRWTIKSPWSSQSNACRAISRSAFLDPAASLRQSHRKSGERIGTNTVSRIEVPRRSTRRGYTLDHTVLWECMACPIHRLRRESNGTVRTIRSSWEGLVIDSQSSRSFHCSLDTSFGFPSAARCW
jgi:hypothetical protein